MNSQESKPQIFKLKINHETKIRLLPLIAFVAAFVLLGLLEPNSFGALWKGRTFELFFIWLIGLELMLGWDTLPTNRLDKKVWVRRILFGISLLLPILYVVLSFYGGLNNAITTLSVQNGVAWASSMPLSTEYLVFGLFFCIMIFLAYGKKGLAAFAIPVFFAVLIGAIYTIDNVFPYGQFTPFQIFVPTTAAVAQSVLAVMGYHTSLDTSQTPTLQVWGTSGTTQFQIAWPCAGIESLLIFTVIALLFLKRIPLSWKAKAGFFALGAAVTYLINIFRIVWIFLLGMNFGETSAQVQEFHFYFGPMYSMTWIIVYPLILILGLMLWQKHKAPKQTQKTMKKT
ncbi:MAG: archaeosortase/exosortase family protein [Candidatus Bathyarchaeota archaeon]|nr:archaeosortase/exosortase family protein [Candidatus Bathyarchaeota archaeon]